ncbi:hypothetical protein GXM_00826 [Nostoc sphaeroides CCNUC1]|uniref:Uncharacterized protein n=1 Tax=Nostoc sphaeroides CCNUC1 TaxID=2653204 RepID=A0A5P8VSC9_9NOSO|nr:hypothetical protein GXM_00826 [Nostoc sphaeroides CCNUC1]
MFSLTHKKMGEPGVTNLKFAVGDTYGWLRLRICYFKRLSS